MKTIKDIELIIFDLDGTLLDTIVDVHHSINYALEKMGLNQIPLQKAREMIGPGNEVFAFIALGEDNLNRKEEFFSIYRPYYEATCLNHTKPFPGVRDLLERTHAFKRAVATNKPLKGTLPILEQLNLMGFFDTVVGPELVDRIKPYPDMIQYCLDQVGVDASQALVIGDTANDILAARSAGVKSCLACWGYSSSQNDLKEQADYAIGHPAEVCEILLCRSNVKRL